MIRSLRIFLWGIVAELEYHLYPWKDDKPPQETVEKYNLPEEPFDKNLHYDWLKSHDEKIGRLQTEMILVLEQINELRKHIKDGQE